MKQVWFDKYRPSKLSEYVFKNESVKSKASKWIQEKSVPHLLLYGPAGTGKTSLAKVILKELEVDPADILEINASSNNGVEYIRDTITNFVSTMSFSGEFRYVLLDESDFLSPNAQAALRNVMEKYINTSRFLLTANYENKIIPALRSRTQSIAIDTIDKQDFVVRLAEILVQEEVEADIETLDIYVNAYYPDMRKCINELQLNSVNGKLLLPDSNSSSSDYKIEMIALFKSKKYTDARKLICQQIRNDEYNDVYTFLYQNSEIWSDHDPIKEKQVIIAIAEGLRDHALVANPEINLSSTLCKLENIAAG